MFLLLILAVSTTYHIILIFLFWKQTPNIFTALYHLGIFKPAKAMWECDRDSTGRRATTSKCYFWRLFAFRRKYEEIYPPEVDEFVYITDDTYTKRQLLRMEHLLLKVLAFDLTVPTTNQFLLQYLRRQGVCIRTENLAKVRQWLPRKLVPRWVKLSLSNHPSVLPSFLVFCLGYRKTF